MNFQQCLFLFPRHVWKPRKCRLYMNSNRNDFTANGKFEPWPVFKGFMRVFVQGSIPSIISVDLKCAGSTKLHLALAETIRADPANVMTYVQIDSLIH